MLEVFLCGLIAFAGGYVMIMRVMARSADVLHGEFIYGRERPVPAWFRYWSKLLAMVRGLTSTGGKAEALN